MKEKKRYSYKIVENKIYARCGITELDKKEFVKKLPKTTTLSSWKEIKGEE